MVLAQISPAPVTQRRTLWSVAVASVLTVLVLALWQQTDARVDAGVGSFESDAPAEPVAAEAVPDLRDLMTELDLWNERVIDYVDETSVSLHYYATPTDSLERLLGELGFGAEIADRIRDTQELDGTVTATAPHASASWSYVQDDGLRVVIDITD